MLLNVPLLSHQLILQSLQLVAVHLNESAALDAYQMVVMLVAVLMLEALRTIPKIDLPAHARFTHQLDRPGHRRIADSFVFSSDPVVQPLNG